MIEETINFWSMVLPTKYSVLLVLCVQFFFNCKKLSYVTFTQWRYQGGTTEIVLLKYLYKNRQSPTSWHSVNICMNPFMHLLPFFYINCGCHEVKTLSRALDYPYSNKFSLFG